MRSRLLALALCLAGCASQTASAPDARVAATPPERPRLSVFAVAHQDDWQLFMQPDAWLALAGAGSRAVFIHVTAGDAGQGMGPAASPYFAAREEGALRAVRFLVNIRSERGAGAGMERETLLRGGQPLLRVRYGPASSWFLRLPDGGFVRDGDRPPTSPGYAATGWQSLERLRTGAIAGVTAIDGTASYASFDQLVEVLRDIVRSEMTDGAVLNLHLVETDRTRNPGDHSDHRHVGLAMEAVAATFPCATLYRHDTYVTRLRPMNMSGEELLADIGAWAVTASGLADHHAPSTWDAVHNSWVGRSYRRVTPPAGPC